MFNRFSNLKSFVVSTFHFCLWNEKEGKNQHVVFCLYLWRTCMLLICTCAKSFKKHNGMKKDVHLLSITNDFWNDSLRWLYKRFTCYSKIRISAEMILNRAKTSQQFSKSKNLQKARKEETWRHAQSLWQNFRIPKRNWCFFFISSKNHLNHFKCLLFFSCGITNLTVFDCKMFFTILETVWLFSN